MRKHQGIIGHHSAKMSQSWQTSAGIHCATVVASGLFLEEQNSEKELEKQQQQLHVHSFQCLHSEHVSESRPFDSCCDCIQQLRFEVEEDLLGFDEDFVIPEFTKTGITAGIVQKREPRDKHPFSELVVEFEIRRDPTYYVTKVVIPLALIVAISWGVFWMDGNELGDRMAISFTGILTAVAYQFIVSDKLPEHVYDTFLDNFILLAFFNLVLTIIINVIVYQGCHHGYALETKRIDKICRGLFPAMFLVGCLMIASTPGSTTVS